MPWTVHIRPRDGTALGTLDEVRGILTDRLHGVRFWRDPSGAEKAKHLPEAHRQMFAELFGHLPADTRGSYDCDQLSFEFFLGSNDVVRTLTVDIRGDGNPILVLRELGNETGWQIHGPNGDAVDLGRDDLPGWERFAKYRDTAVDRIRNEGNSK